MIKTIKTISINAKANDTQNWIAYDENGKEIESHEGYGLNCSVSDGDTVFFKINNETGQIFNWKPLTIEDFNGEK